jgi:alkylhydroperoxidase family enzyme
MMDTTTSAPRIAPLEPPYDADTEAALAKWMPPGAAVEPLSLFRMLHVHGELASRMRPLGAGLLGHGLLEAREREIVILRTCARCGAEYEWGVHAAAFAGAVGLGDEQVAATVLGAGEDPVFSPRERLLVRLADELHDGHAVSQPLWSELAEAFSEQQLLELLVLAGWYRTISYVINATRLPNEPWAASFPRG